MSDLQRSFAKAKLSNLPFNPPRPLNVLDNEGDYFDEAEEEDDLRPLPSPSGLPEDDSSSASSASSTGTIVPSPGRRLFARGKGPESTSRFAPLPWTHFFAQELVLEPTGPGQISHRAYVSAPSSKSSPIFVMHHGAGSSALSFGACVQQMQKAVPDAGFLAIDARGHGETSVGDPAAVSNEDGMLDLSLATLADDFEGAYDAVRARMGWATDVGVVLVGHSLGGAVVTHVARRARLRAKVLGFAVLDVVEGSAMDALQHMQAHLATRPSSFASVEEGIDWHVKSRTVRNTFSARASVPPLLRLEASPPPPPPGFARAGFEDASGSFPPPQPAAANPGRWRWRTDLSSTSAFWEDWFGGMSSKFLAARGGKLLILAGTDRLDKELMIGQMQGKYQLQVFPEAGHFLHEDVPEKTANILVDFWKRNDGSKLVLPPKVGELLAKNKPV